MKKVFITGASGFVGKHLIELLGSKDYEIVCGVFGSSLDIDNVQSIPLDLGDASKVNQVIREVKPDWVFHLAALSSPAASFHDDNKTLVNNIVAQVNLLNALVTYAPQARTLVVGSAEEYGKVRNENLPIDELCPLNPLSPYAVSKVTQDFMGLQYFNSFGLPIIRVRPFNHIGEGQTAQFVLPAFAKQIAEIEAGLKAPVLHVGDLSATRDFTDVKDMVRAYELTLLHGIPGEVYNIGSGKEVKIQDLLDLLLSLSTVSVEVVVDQSKVKPADVPRMKADYSKFSNLTGWNPDISLRSTVERVLDYWRDTVRNS